MGNQKIGSLVLRSESMMTKIMLSQENQIIQHIQSQKIQPTQPINQMGDTLGHYAAYKGHFQVLQYLIKLNDTFNTPNYRGQTAIDVALPPVRQWMYKNRQSPNQEIL